MYNLNEEEFIKIKDKSKDLKYSSFEYTEYADIHNYDLIENNDDIILLLGKNREAKICEYIWAANDVNILIKSLTSENTFYLSFIPEDWFSALEQNGFKVRNAWHDYFISRLDLIQTENYAKYDFLKLNEIDIASAITRECRDQSRGFTGQTSAWIHEWLNERNSIKNTAVITHRLPDNDIAGIVLVGIYGHGSANGPTLWVKEIAVKPKHQNQGIGRKLLLQALSYGKTHSAKRAFLAADEQNKNAINLYKSLGFVPSEEQSEVTYIKFAEPQS